MPIDKEQFLKQFVKQALDERIVLSFLGAGGVMVSAGYPNWADLCLHAFARDLGTPINESNRLLPD